MNDLCKVAHHDIIEKEREDQERLEEAKKKFIPPARRAIHQALGIWVDPTLFFDWEESFYLRASFKIDGHTFMVEGGYHGLDVIVSSTIPYETHEWKQVEIGKNWLSGRPRYKDKNVPVTKERRVRINRPADLIMYEICGASEGTS